MGEHRLRRLLLSIVLIAAPIAASPFWLSTSALAQNDQEGDNSAEVDQDGDASVGKAIGGQEVSVTGGARTRVDATNSSKNVRAETGEANARNTANGFTGQLSDTGDDEAENNQEGDNEFDLSQSADASTGDAIGGQVIGVTSRGPVEINATNHSEDVDLITGDAEATNEADVFTGLLAIAEGDGIQANLCGNNLFDSDPEFDFDLCINFDETDASNDQDGDNEADVSQRADATTGDGIGGQVIGVSGSDVVVNASNTSKDVDVRTGDAEATNSADVRVGPLAIASNEGIQANLCGNNLFGSDPGINIAICANIAMADANNNQDGDNSADLSQRADANSGDGIAGQVIGVDSTGDSRVTAANTSEDVDVRTGDADATNDALVISGLTGVASNEGLQLNACGNNLFGSDPFFNLAVCANVAIASPDNEQTGDNSADVDQSADAASGDGVAGQVIGVTSAGNSVVDATNTSRNVDVDSGDADATNKADVIVGLLGVANNEGAQINLCGNNIGSDPSINIAICLNIASSNPDNVQTGDNEADVGQRADASTGDAVGGQVIGVDSGGDSLIRAANTSENVDADSGDADASNDADVDVGQTGTSFSDIAQINICGNNLDSEPGFNFGLCVNAALTNVENEQTGDNTSDVNQSAGASTGDAVGGQVLGITSTGDTRIDATNRSEDVDADTGDSDSDNDADIAVGQTGSAAIDEGLDIEICDDAICINALPPATASNVMNGDNDSELSQSTSSHSGDAVAGQVVGVTGRDRGSADLVLDNTSLNTRATSGDDDEDNTADTFVGLLTETILV